MVLTLMANIESFGDAGCIAWIDSIKGMVVQGTEPKDTFRELLISLKVKMAHDYGVKIDQIQEREVGSKEEMDALIKQLKLSEGKAKKEISLKLGAC